MLQIVICECQLYVCMFNNVVLEKKKEGEIEATKDITLWYPHEEILISGEEEGNAKRPGKTRLREWKTFNRVATFLLGWDKLENKILPAWFYLWENETASWISYIFGFNGLARS